MSDIELFMIRLKSTMIHNFFLPSTMLSLAYAMWKVCPPASGNPITAPRERYYVAFIKLKTIDTFAMGRPHVEYDINTVCYPVIESRKHCTPLTNTEHIILH